MHVKVFFNTNIDNIGSKWSLPLSVNPCQSPICTDMARESTLNELRNKMVTFTRHIRIYTTSG